jgi:hypothetical protein
VWNLATQLKQKMYPAAEKLDPIFMLRDSQKAVSYKTEM